jgi:L-ascorbate metabolism protein UlaG (beta-lactamase superfamily)
METPGGKRVLIDPWVTGNPVVPDELKDPGPFDVLLLTHGHNDHTGDAVDLATRHSPKAVLAMIELGDYLEANGVQHVIGYNKGGTAEAEGLKFTMVDARHSSSFTLPDGTICTRATRTATSSRWRTGGACTWPATPPCSGTWP